MRSALLDEDVLQSAVERVTTLIAAGRIKPEHVEGLTALHANVKAANADERGGAQ